MPPVEQWDTCPDCAGVGTVEFHVDGSSGHGYGPMTYQRKCWTCNRLGIVRKTQEKP